MCLLQHWLTATPIIAALAPNWATYLLFVLQAKYRYRCVLCRAKQLFRKIDGDNTIAACHQLFLTSAVNLNYVFGIKSTGTCWDTYLVKFGFSWNDRRCSFLRSCTLTAHLSNDLWGYFSCVTLDCAFPFEVWFSTLSNPLPVIVDKTDGCVASLYSCMHTYHFEV